MKINCKKMILCLITVALLMGCVEQDIHKARATWFGNQNNEVIVAIAGRLNFMKEDTNFMKGIYMAVDEVNANNGIQGRLLTILEKDDKASVIEGTIIAQDIIQNPGVVAVIGHTSVAGRGSVADRAGVWGRPVPADR